MDALLGIEERTRQLDNVAAPIHLDVCNVWPQIQMDAVIVANMFHISPEETVAGFFSGAAERLSEHGLFSPMAPTCVMAGIPHRQI